MSTTPADNEYSARRIHQSLGGTTAFLKGYTVGELILFLAVAFATLVGAAVVPATFTIPLMGFGLMCLLLLGLLHKVKPDYLWLTEWLAARLGWAIKNKEYTHDESNSEIRYLSRLGQVFPHAIERSDGALVGAMQIEPANMALEDDEAWTKAVQSFSEFMNATVDFPVKLYITSRESSQDEIVRSHQQRLSDADVRSRPVLKRLLERYLDANIDENGDIAAETATIREYYVITTVTDEEIDQLSETGDSVLAYLATLPVVGRLFGRFQGDELSTAEREQLKEEKLQTRLGQIRRGGSSLYHCSVTAVDAPTLAGLVEEYWTGRTEDETTNALATFPVVHGISEDSSGMPALDNPPETGETRAETAEPTVPPEEQLDDASTMQQSAVAPSTVDWETTYAVINDEHYVRTFWIEQFPESPVDGMFERLLLETDLRTDLSIHVDPYDNQSAVDMMADWISDLKVNQHDANGLKAEDLQEDIDRAKYMRSLIRANKASFYRTGVFIRLAAESKQALDNDTKRLRAIVKDTPANCTLKVANRWQEKGLVTVSPLGRNELGQDRMSTMTNQAIGAMFPFSSNYQMMEGGIEYGYHGHNGTPVRINPWALETGHSELVVGMPGAGKTFGGIMRHLRMMKRRNDTMLVLIDPVGGFRGIADALDAKTITVGGETRLNPLEIRRTPDEMLEADDSASPLAAKKDEAYAILENFLTAREIDIGTKTGVLSYVIDEAYRQAGAIEGDVSTHTPGNSPTMTDVHRILADLSSNPEAHNIAASDSAQECAAEYADELAIALQPFREGGAYDNLSKPSEIDILEGDNKVVYIDLGQIEGSTSGVNRQTFMMQLLLSTIYQQAKRADRNVELAIDEAHYLFADQANLDFLETAFRHQRHAGLRMVLFSQTAQEFYATEQAEHILGMCPIKLFHKLPELDDETADKIGLTREQRRYVRAADAGKADLGYSQALVQVEEHGTYPLHVVADEFEQRVIDYEPADRAFIEQAISEDEALAAFGAFLEREAEQNALTERFGFSEQAARQVLDNEITKAELLTAAATTLNDGVAARTDGGDPSPEVSRDGNTTRDEESETGPTGTE